MDKFDLLHEDVHEVRDSVLRIETKVDDLSVRLAVVEDRTTRRSAFIAAVVGFLAGLVGR